MLLLSGTRDHVVEPGNTLRMAARLRAAGVPVTAEVYPDINHGGIMAAISEPLSFLAPAREATLNFIAAQGACER
jgi:acetyl esterase/lipase